jgi:hypothetical protein
MVPNGTAMAPAACGRRARVDPLRYDREVTLPPDERTVGIDRATLEAEVTRVVDAADTRGITIRALGSIGVALHSHDAAQLIPDFERTYADIDFAAYRREAKVLTALMTELGYLDDREVYIGSEGSRSIFDDPARGIHVDVFYDKLEFCHVIPLAGRLGADRPTIPVTELLLSKLQIVKINDRDVVDIVLLVLDHPLGSGDDDTVDVARVASLCAAEWGLWRTLTQNLEKVQALAAVYPQLGAAQRARVAEATGELKTKIDSVPKPMAWRMRDRVGDRRQWWTDVDEVR